MRDQIENIITPPSTLSHKNEILVAEESILYFYHYKVVKVWPPIIFHLNVMNIKKANFHKIIVTKHNFFDLDRLHNKLQYKVQNTTAVVKQPGDSEKEKGKGEEKKEKRERKEKRKGKRRGKERKEERRE